MQFLNAHFHFAINTSVSATTKQEPYLTVFGQKPNASQGLLDILANQGIFNEEDVPTGLIAESTPHRPPTTESVGLDVGEITESQPLSPPNSDLSMPSQRFADNLPPPPPESDLPPPHLADNLPPPPPQSDLPPPQLTEHLHRHPAASDDSLPPPADHTQSTAQSSSLPSPSESTVQQPLTTEGVSGCAIGCPPSTGAPTSNDQPAGDSLSLNVRLAPPPQLNEHLHRPPAASESVSGCAIGCPPSTGAPTSSAPEQCRMEDVVMAFGTQPVTQLTQPSPIQNGQKPTLQRLMTPKRKLPSPDIGTPHRKLRKDAEKHFLEQCNRQQVNYDRKKGKMCNDYVKGDTVAIRIPKPDRTNTSKKLMTCKVLEKKNDRYRLYSPSGILGTTFSYTDLLDFRNMRYDDVESVQPSDLQKVAFTKAARDCSGFLTKKDSSVCQRSVQQQQMFM